MLENITMKKRQEEQKNKIVEIREINTKNREELAEKLKSYEAEINRVVSENNNLTSLSRDLEAKLFKERADWIE